METENPKLVTNEELFLSNVKSLERKIKKLESENAKLQNQLAAKVIYEDQLSKINHHLQNEIINRQQTETALRLILERLISEKNDLELILDTTISHGDTIEAILYDKTLSLVREVSIDGLTQIANRRAFDLRLANEWQRLSREKAQMSLLLCDVDFFKRYNDRYGHSVGDTCLKAVAKEIECCIRRPADLAARYGGEEFGVILPNTQKEGAIHIAEQICQAVANLRILHESSYVKDYVTISVGVSTTQPEYSISPKTLIESADKGLYLAKNQGRDRTVFTCD